MRWLHGRGGAALLVPGRPPPPRGGLPSKVSCQRSYPEESMGTAGARRSKAPEENLSIAAYSNQQVHCLVPASPLAVAKFL